MSKQWMPVPSGTLQWSHQEGIIIRDAKLEVLVRPLETFYDSFGKPHQRLLGIESVEVELPDSLRLCRQVEVADSAPITAAEVEALEYATDLLHECATRPYLVMPEDIKHIATLDALIDRLKGDGGQDGDK